MGRCDGRCRRAGVDVVVARSRRRARRPEGGRPGAPLGLFAANNPAISEKLAEAGIATTNLAGAEGWYNFFVTNLVPVTLGNIVGAALGMLFRFWAFRRFIFLSPRRARALATGLSSGDPARAPSPAGPGG